MTWLTAIFKFFASLKVAVALLILLGISFGAGTFIESYYGTDAAQMVVYRTLWMAVLLICLGLNLLASALDRIPWKKKHIGFLTTHLGIIVILAGSLISHAFGIEGQLAIQEGKTGSRMTLSDPLIQIFSVDSNEKWIYPIKKRPFSWTGREELIADEHGTSSVTGQVFFRANEQNLSRPELVPVLVPILLINYPKAKLNEIVEPSETGSPALHFSLAGSMASVEQWLFLDDPSRNTLNMGPATIHFTTGRLSQDHPKNKSNEFGTLQFNFESGENATINLNSKSIGKIFPLAGTPYKVKVNRILKDAIVDGNQLMERKSTEMKQEILNPAVEITLSGKDLSERHTVFARFPEFPTLHGMKPSEAHVRISYEIPELQQGGLKNELRFIFRDNELPSFQIKAGEKITEGNLELGKEVPTGWMDFKFKVDEYFKRAVVRKDFLPLLPSSQSVEAIPVIQVEFSKSGQQKTLWLEQGEITYLEIGGSNYHVLYGLKTKPLGFQIQLLDFEIETDPGTDRPASFESRIRFKDASRGVEREQLIQMNEPLKHRGFKVYQSAYQQTSGEADTSIFTVAHDPGNSLKYLGAIIMIAGIGMLFYIKSLSTLKGSDPKLRNK